MCCTSLNFYGQNSGLYYVGIIISVIMLVSDSRQWHRQGSEVGGKAEGSGMHIPLSFLILL